MRHFAYATIKWNEEDQFHFVLDGKKYQITNIKSNDELYGDVAMVSYDDKQDSEKLYARVITPGNLKRAWEVMEQAEARACEARYMLL